MTSPGLPDNPGSLTSPGLPDNPGSLTSPGLPDNPGSLTSPGLPVNPGFLKSPTRPAAGRDFPYTPAIPNSAFRSSITWVRERVCQRTRLPMGSFSISGWTFRATNTGPG